MRTTSADLHTLTGAYAVNALTDTERAAFETHLLRCESCATEVAELTATATRLGLAVEFAPPPQLRARVLAAAAETRQLSPHTPRLPRARGWGRAGGLLAAACLVAVAFVTVQRTGSDDDRLAQLSSQYGRFSDLLSTPDARLVTATGAGGATGTAVVSPSRDELLFLSRDLPALPGDRVYQLWLIDAHGPRGAGVLASPTAPHVTDGVSGAQKAALTVEPAGGSQDPTSDPVVVIALT
ncbi:Anti-sigma-K factor RskA [Lentzea xinjiangensis]|uniref:Regulator of SigK n=1 Tax=Lentzea xinjiangensis TaxID=402600 RepID=A0A1H9VVI8_9PSEU|nr:anti-sigma factor [Lentzea xinjiangensis]SES25549.1 Anti-sigma-K factor RskA [Lentzea xinjiangensis]